MYAIIYQKKDNDDDVFFVKNNNGSIYLYSKLEEAQKNAEEIPYNHVISLEKVTNEEICEGCREPILEHEARVDGRHSTRI